MIRLAFAVVVLSCISTSTLAAQDDRPRGIELLVDLLLQDNDPRTQIDVLDGMAAGLEGRRNVTVPANWPQAYQQLKQSTDAAIRWRATELALVFNDDDAIAWLRSVANDASRAEEERNRAIELLAARKTQGFADELVGLLRDPSTQSAAVRGLAKYDARSIADSVLQSYPKLSETARRDALLTLASRRVWAERLIQAIETNQVASTDLDAFTVRQLQAVGNSSMIDRIAAVWGTVRESDSARRSQISRTRRELRGIVDGHVSAGKKLFAKHCASCHKMFGEGETVGPDLTGAQRKNLDYLLENILDPSATVSKDFQMEVIRVADGRVITGLVIAETDETLTIKTVNEKLTISNEEIEDRRKSPLSLMPDNLLKDFSREELWHLFAYLMQ